MPKLSLGGQAVRSAWALDRPARCSGWFSWIGFGLQSSWALLIAPGRSDAQVSFSEVPMTQAPTCPLQSLAIRALTTNFLQENARSPTYPPTTTRCSELPLTKDRNRWPAQYVDRSGFGDYRGYVGAASKEFERQWKQLPAQTNMGAQNGRYKD